jgi:hypothetical protein
MDGTCYHQTVSTAISSTSLRWIRLSTTRQVSLCLRPHHALFFGSESVLLNEITINTIVDVDIPRVQVLLRQHDIQRVVSKGEVGQRVYILDLEFNPRNSLCHVGPHS